MNRILLLIALFSICANAQELGKMYFLTEDIGWIQNLAYSEYGYIPTSSFKTTNGGNTWTQLDSHYNYRSIQFVNDSAGFLFSRDGNLYKTTDKGESWKFISTWPSNIPFTTIKFANEMIGFSSSRIYFAKTTNGGITWDTLENFYCTAHDFELISKERIIIIDNSTLLPSGKKAYIVTKDGGLNWDTVSCNRRNTDLDRIEFPDSLHGFLSTFISNPQYPDTPGIFKTTDGGTTWSFLPISYMLPYFSMADSLVGLLYAGKGNGGTFYRTSNGFATWEKMLNKKAYEYNLYSHNLLYACGDSGYFAKSTDCGDTWTEIPFNVLNPTGISESNQSVNDYSLQQNYPNPFNPSTKIKYSVAVSQVVTLRVYDILGNEITTLVNEMKQPGTYEVTFDGSKLSSGIYFYKLNSGPFTQTRKFVLMK